LRLFKGPKPHFIPILSIAGEIEGLDLHEHGAVAYPEYMMEMNDGTPKTLTDPKLKTAPVSGD